MFARATSIFHSQSHQRFRADDDDAEYGEGDDAAEPAEDAAEPDAAAERAERLANRQTR